MMISCKQASLLLSQSLDRRLTWWERLQLRVHLLMCDACKQFSHALARLRQSLKLNADAIELDTTIQLSAKARAHITDVIRSNQH